MRIDVLDDVVKVISIQKKMRMLWGRNTLKEVEELVRSAVKKYQLRVDITVDEDYVGFNSGDRVVRIQYLELTKKLKLIINRKKPQIYGVGKRSQFWEAFTKILAKTIVDQNE